METHIQTHDASCIAFSASSTALLSKRKQLSSEEWGKLRPLIERLYLKEHMTFKQIARILEEEYGFSPTKHQFTRKLGKWGIRKNSSRAERDNRPRDFSTSTSDAHIHDYMDISEIEDVLWQKETPKGEFNSSSIEPANEDIPRPSSPSQMQNMSPVVNNSDGDTILVKQGTIPRVQDETDESAELRFANVPAQNCLHETTELDLAKLLEQLEIETKGLPRAEEILTSFEPVMDQEAEEPLDYINPVQTLARHHGNTSQHRYLNKSSHNTNRLTKIINTGPFRWNNDAWFPSGIAMLPPSPFNELYPFPKSAPKSFQTHRTSKPLILRNREMEGQYKQMLQQLQTVFEDSNFAILEAKKTLADNLFNQGKYRYAENLYREIFEHGKSHSNPTQSTFLDSGFCLLDCMRGQGKVREAFEMHKKMHQQVLSNSSKDRSIVAKSLSCRINLYLESYDGDKVESDCRDLIQIGFGDFGARSLITLDAISRLASYKQCQGDHLESERLYAILIQLEYELRFPPEYLLLSMTHLARLLQRRHQMQESVSLFRKVLSDTLIYSGEEHPNTVSTYLSFGQVLSDAGEFDESRLVLRKCVDLSITVFGEDSFWMMLSMEELGLTLDKMEQLEAATYWLQKALVGYFELGLTNIRPLYSFAKLMKYHTKSGSIENMQKICTMVDQHMRVSWVGELDEISEENLPMAVGWMYGLGSALWYCGQFQRSKYWLEKALMGAFPPEIDRYSLLAFRRLRECYEELGKPEDEEKLISLMGQHLRVQVAKEEEHGEPIAQKTINWMHDFGTTLMDDCEQFQEAAYWFQKVLAEYRKIGKADDESLHTLMSLKDCYQKLGWSNDIERISPIIDQQLRILVAKEEENGGSIREETIYWMDDFGDVLKDRRQFREAAYWFEKVVAEDSKIEKADKDSLRTLEMLEECYKELGQVEDIQRIAAMIDEHPKFDTEEEIEEEEGSDLEEMSGIEEKDDIKEGFDLEVESHFDFDFDFGEGVA